MIPDPFRCLIASAFLAKGTIGVADRFIDFLRRPTAETFLSIRAAVLDDPDFDPMSDRLRQVEALVAAGAQAAALALVPQLMSCWLLSPSAHAVIAQAARETGDAARAASETLVAQACLFGLMQTGSGTEAAPYRVIHVTDEADVLGFLGRAALSQRRDVADGRFCDVIRDTTGEDHWFDMTESLLRMSARFAAPVSHGG